MPITCLQLMWVLFTGIFKEGIYEHLKDKNLLPDGQIGYRKQSRGRKDVNSWKYKSERSTGKVRRNQRDIKIRETLGGKNSKVREKSGKKFCKNQGRKLKIREKSGKKVSEKNWQPCTWISEKIHPKLC